VLILLGLVVLAAVWAGPLVPLTRQSFAAHMAMHIAVVAIAAPLFAAGLVKTRFDPVARRPQLFPPIPASLAELIVVWGWHVPALHHAARSELTAFMLEQAMFFLSGLWLWLSALGGSSTQSWRRGAGIGALLFTSIHMTLVGALFALAPRPLYTHFVHLATLDPLGDQHLGGAIMLLVGGASYLGGALWLTLGMMNEVAPLGRGQRTP
jgi:putative membrane protein